MSVVTRYVNPRSAGGDGTTTALSGANAAYSSLSAWEAAEQTDLVSDGDSHVVICATGDTPGGGGSNLDADTTAVTISGWTTGASNGITIKTENDRSNGKRHTGAWSTNHYRLHTSNNGDCILCQEDYVDFEGLQIYNSGNITANHRNIELNGSGAWNVLDCFMRGRSYSGSFLAGVAVQTGTTPTLTVKNCMFWEYENVSVVDIVQATINVYNLTTYGRNQAYYQFTAGSTWTGRNCLIEQGYIGAPGGPGFYTVGTWSDMDYHCDSGNSAPGSNSVNNATIDFVSKAAGDLHLASTDSDAFEVGQGPNANANVPTADIDGDDISSLDVIDIGADYTVPTTVTRYVNPRSSGGDGTTTALSGANAAYSSLSAWEAAEQKDLPVNKEIPVVICATGDTPGGGGANLDADTTAVNIDGWTSTSIYTITVKTEASYDNGKRHQGAWSTSHYRLSITGNSIALRVGQNFYTVEGLQIEQVSGAAAGVYCVSCATPNLASSVISWKDCIIRNQDTASVNNTVFGINGGLGSGTFTFENIVWQNRSDAGGGWGIVYFNVANYTYKVFNCTAERTRNPGQGFACYAGTIQFKNTISKGGTSGILLPFYDNGTFIDTANCKNNLSNHTDAPGSNPVNSTTLTYVDAANTDYHLDSDNDTAAIDAGIGPGADSDIPTTDIDGHARSGATCDIGVDEIPVVASGVISGQKVGLGTKRVWGFRGHRP